MSTSVKQYVQALVGLTDAEVAEIKDKTGVENEEDLRYLEEQDIDLFLPSGPVLKKRKVMRVCQYLDMGGKITESTTMKKISDALEKHRNPPVPQVAAAVVMDLTDNVEPEPWRGNLMFDCFTKNPFDSSGPLVLMKNHNILHMCHLVKGDPFLFFCTKTYDHLQGFKGSGWQKLKKDLKTAATDCGYTICCNHSQNGSFRLSCTCGTFSRAKRLDKLPEGTRGKNKKSRPYRPVDKSSLCSFYFNITVTPKGFAVVNGNCNTMHNGHIKIEKPQNLIAPSQKIR